MAFSRCDWRVWLGIAVGSLLGLAPVSAAQNGPRPEASAEVMHWLTAEKDAAALARLRNAFVARGGRWIDSPMPGAGEVGRAAAVNRILGGRPPAVFQFSLGMQLDELARGDLLLLPPTDIEQTGAALPEAVARVSKHRGRFVAVPINIRGENWMFYNKAVLREAGVAPPRTWPEFLHAASVLQSKGKLPIALGGQAWQERILFNDVMLGVGGVELYRRVFEQRDLSAVNSPAMLETFRVFGELRKFVDSSSVGRRWPVATKMVVHGKAAFQFMGDWAKGEIAAAGLKPGREIGCALAPSATPAYLMQIDAFVFARTRPEGATAGQRIFAAAVWDPKVQAEFAARLGAIPARMDAPQHELDDCSKLAARTIRDSKAQVLDSYLSLPGGVAGAIDDAVAQFWNDPGMSPAQGRALLISVFRSSR